MQITRQRHDESNSSGVYEECPYCSGKGIVKSPRAVSIEIQRKINQCGKTDEIESFYGQTIEVEDLSSPKHLRRLRGPIPTCSKNGKKLRIETLL